ncbi:MAG: type IX secretion system outer membrane channel protein PorV [Bacteroidales bacterium]|nr:type IX secretion system outer membrane channel protein PorV [Bacteroidales bacterium]
MNITKKSLFVVVLTLVTASLLAQTTETSNQKMARLGLNTISTAVSFLTLSPDARSGSMGDLGVSTSPDANSMHWNPAKYAFIEDKAGFSISYTPWMRSLVPDINLANLAGYYKINDKSAVAMTMKYFSLGEVDFRDENNTSLGIVKPNEFSIDATYSRKFSEKISGAVAARFIYSNLTQGITNTAGSEPKAGTSVAADIAMYYTEPVTLGKTMTGEVSFGINISNIGSKVSYDVSKVDKEFIPTNLRFGPSLLMNIDDFNSLTFAVDFNKLLVPTAPIRNSEGDIIYGKDDNVNSIMGLIQSFYDAPGYTVVSGDTIQIGKFREELQEFYFSVGAEYWYNNLLSIRAGYFFENPRKGDRQFVTLGAGLRYNVFGIDLSYLISIGQQNPLQNTLRFSLLFNFDTK